MPRQNRVHPSGEIIATPHRGALMGNRGVLHDSQGRLKRRWQGRRWLVCVLRFRGRKRQVMAPGHYTELFFLDEATGLAAGHRPCAECRRERYTAFRDAWRLGVSGANNPLPSAEEIDRQLHKARVAPGGSKRLFVGSLNELPDGVLVQHSAWGDDPWLLWHDRLFAWTAAGYAARIVRPGDCEVQVLTPESTVAAMCAGYIPEIHRSALTLT